MTRRPAKRDVAEQTGLALARPFVRFVWFVVNLMGPSGGAAGRLGTTNVTNVTNRGILVEDPGWSPSGFAGGRMDRVLVLAAMPG